MEAFFLFGATCQTNQRRAFQFYRPRDFQLYSSASSRMMRSRSSRDQFVNNKQLIIMIDHYSSKWLIFELMTNRLSIVFCQEFLQNSFLTQSHWRLRVSRIKQSVITNNFQIFAKDVHVIITNLTKKWVRKIFFRKIHLKTRVAENFDLLWELKILA